MADAGTLMGRRETGEIVVRGSLVMRGYHRGGIGARLAPHR